MEKGCRFSRRLNAAVSTTHHQMKETLYSRTVLENVAAVAAEFQRQDQFKDFYNQFAEKLNGTPGIWLKCVELGEIFSRAYHRAGKKYGWEAVIAVWMDTVETFVNTVIKESLANGDVDWGGCKLDSYADYVIDREIELGNARTWEGVSGHIASLLNEYLNSEDFLDSLADIAGVAGYSSSVQNLIDQTLICVEHKQLDPIE